MRNALKNILLSYERDWLNKVKHNFLNPNILDEYGLWLVQQNSKRGKFVSELSKALKTKNIAHIPSDIGIHSEWREVIGYDIITSMIENNCVEEISTISTLFRPSFRLEYSQTEKGSAIGSSKIGGLPDLPLNFHWPTGDDCKAIFNDDTKGETRLAGFLGQINFSEIYTEDYHLEIPSTGLLSFFSFQDVENDNPDKIGVGAFYFPTTENFHRSPPPMQLTDGNTVMDELTLVFKETYDLPETYDSPWENDFPFETDNFEAFFDTLREKNFENLLGYARSTTGGDPTIDKKHQHLITLENRYGCRLHLQIEVKHLTKSLFNKVLLSWVDFD